jgi:hypothetical protein
MMDIVKFAHLFLWGIQFDQNLARLSNHPEKADKGTYWTPAVIAFLDRLGFDLGYETDVEVQVIGDDKKKRWLDMVWIKKEGDDIKEIIFIEHEGKWAKMQIEDAILRLQSKHFELKKEPNLRVLITYPNSRVRIHSDLMQRVEEFANQVLEESQNLVIEFAREDWEKCVKLKKIDLTMFTTRPQKIAEELYRNSALSLFKQ